MKKTNINMNVSTHSEGGYDLITRCQHLILVRCIRNLKTKVIIQLHRPRFAFLYKERYWLSGLVSASYLVP